MFSCMPCAKLALNLNLGNKVHCVHFCNSPESQGIPTELQCYSGFNGFAS